MTRDAEQQAQADAARERNEQQPTTYPPTPGDRNEEQREERKFGRPAEGDSDDEDVEQRDPEGERTSYVSREDTPDA